MESRNGVMCIKAGGLRDLPFRCCVLLLWFCCSVTATAIKSDKCWIVHLSKLKNADCKHKSLVTVPQDLDHDIKVFNLQENEITVLSNKEFERYPSLQEIDLTGNRIDTLFEHAFEGLQNLQRLDLESNELSEIPSLSFQHISALRILSLKSNQIHTVLEQSFKLLTHIELLNLENCYISFVHPKAFLGLESLFEINIANNDLQVIDSTMEFALPSSLKVFRIHDNNWICDCKLRWLRVWTKNTSEINWEFNQNTPSCSGPPIIQNINWKSLSPDQFACAPQIVQNNKTSMEVSIKGNLTVECLITGDPLPIIIWMQNSQPYTGTENIKTKTYYKKGKKYTNTVLTLKNVQKSDIGVYKCIAQNQGGTAEVSYSIKFINTPEPPEEEKEVLFLGLSKNVAIGICTVFAAFLLLFLIIVCCFLCFTISKKRKQKRAYKVREYQRPSNNVNKQETHHINDKTSTKPKTKSNRYAGSNSDNQLLAEKQELLHEKPIVHDTPDISAIPSEETNRNTVDNRFKMKIFTNYRDDGNTAAVAEDQHEPPLPPPPPEVELTNQASNNIPDSSVRTKQDRDTPDLLKDRIITNRAIPVPPPSVPNHIQSTHPRARENPYVTASELKASTLKKKTASADDLLDGREADQYNMPVDTAKRSSSRDDILLSPSTSNHSYPTKKTRFQEPILKQRDHSSTCTNPVCMKDQVLDQPQKTILDQQLRQGKGGGGYCAKGTQREIDVDDLSSPDSRYDSMGYKTIPARLSKTSHRSPEPTHYSPPTSIHASPTKSASSQESKTLPKRFHIPSKTVSFSDEGHPIIDLTQEMPEPIVIPSFASPDRGPAKSNIAGLYGTLPHKMKNPQGHKKGQPNGSPPGKHTKTAQSTTLDDLLSPPFGHSPSGSRKLGSQTLPHKKKPKPGEKDEFGTAV